MGNFTDSNSECVPGHLRMDVAQAVIKMELSAG